MMFFVVVKPGKFGKSRFRMYLLLRDFSTSEKEEE